MRPALAAALLLALTAAVYLPTLRYPFLYEDHQDPGRFERSTWNEYRARGWDGRIQLAAANPLRIVPSLSFDVARVLSGLDPWGDRLISISVHLVNSVLVLALAWLVLPPWGAVITMGVFALHPLQVEAVAYVSARSDLLATTGLLLALLAASGGSLAGAVCGAVFACLSKEAAIMAWGLVPLWALVTGAAFPVRRFALIGVGGVAVVGLVFAVRVHGEAPAISATHIGQTVWAIERLVSLVFVPVGLTIDHAWQIGATAQALAVGLAVGLTTWAAMAWRETWVGFAWLMTLLWCLPRLLMPTLEGMHEHHMAPVLVFWALAVGAGVSSIRVDTVRSIA